MIKTEDYKRELLTVFFSQKGVIVWATLLISVGAILIALFWPPTYAASGTILVKGKKTEKSPESLDKELTRYFPITKEDLASEEQILTSHDVIQKTIQYLKEKNQYPKTLETTSPIGKIKRFLTHLIEKTLSLQQDRAEGLEYGDVYAIKDAIRTTVIPASNVIKVTFHNRYLDDAVVTLDALMNQYILYRMQVYNPSEAEVFFSQQLDRFKDAFGDKQGELVALIERTKMSDPLKEIENNLLIKKDIEQQLNLLKNDAIEKRLYIEHLNKALLSEKTHLFSFIENNIPLNNLSSTLQQLIIEHGTLLRKYSENSDKARLVNRQIDDTFAALKAEIARYRDNQLVQLRIINDKINLMESKLHDIESANVRLQTQFINSQRLKQEIDLIQTSYDTFYKKREEARINNTLDITNLSSYVSILSKAFPVKGPVFPKKTLVIPLGIFVGFLVGCSLGFSKEYFDHTFKKPSDVQNYVGLPVIFSIPLMEAGKKKVFTTIILPLALLATVPLSRAVLSSPPVTSWMDSQPGSTHLALSPQPRPSEAAAENGAASTALETPVFPSDAGGVEPKNDRTRDAAKPNSVPGSSAETNTVRKLISQWSLAWERQQWDDYIAFYTEDFNGRQRNRQGWKEYKQRINREVGQIRLMVSDLEIAREKDALVAIFRQRYRSDRYSDEGLKRLYLRKEDDRLKIWGEKWNP